MKITMTFDSLEELNATIGLRKKKNDTRKPKAGVKSDTRDTFMAKNDTFTKKDIKIIVHPPEDDPTSSYNAEELEKILIDHKAWLSNPSGKHSRQAGLSGAQLHGADLALAELGMAIFCGADLTDANLDSAELTCADFEKADLRNADLQDANLTGAQLDCADLRGANLNGARMENVTFFHTKVTPEQMPDIAKAIGLIVMGEDET